MNECGVISGDARDAVIAAAKTAERVEAISADLAEVHVAARLEADRLRVYAPAREWS